jgi:hypothetical protein
MLDTIVMLNAIPQDSEIYRMKLKDILPWQEVQIKLLLWR